jgi:adenylate cyclase
METSAACHGWLEDSAGAGFPLRGAFAIGRGEPNDLPLADDRVSRRHALIQAQGEGEFWLVDLGSRNGTYLNGRRVRQPVRLADGDQLQVGGTLLHFRQPPGQGRPVVRVGPDLAHVTLVDLREAPCWLLVADVIGSTALMSDGPPERTAMLMGHWLMRCTRLIKAAGGTMNQYLGDGFFAYWRADQTQAAGIVRCLEALRHLQQPAQPPFRIALHLGKAWLGGGPSLGEESLSGPDVHFVFRMEKLAGSLGVDCLLSEAAAAAFPGDPAAAPLGSHPLPGFPGEFPFLRLVSQER